MTDHVETLITVTETPGTPAPRDDLDADYTPRYIWLARLLRGEIEDGTYPPGSLLPSSARLADVHTVSKATARHALGVLVKSGHARRVESKPHQVIWQLAAPVTTGPALARS
jgi:DNA-binding FadR family transcriptional regulator